MRPIAAMVTAVLFFVGAAVAQVRVWEEPRVIPTYLWGPGEPNPIFYTGRSYVAIKGNIYPYPLYDSLTDQRADRTYKAIYLENQYIKLCVIPELGGRIFSGLDKTNGYAFFYEQHVVKPGILSMIGAWTSGGVEWNIPHIHRASGLLPVDYRIVENPDGSKTVWVGEMELRHRMRWIVGITLYPDKSYIEATVKLFNRTPLPHTFLAFANAAVPVDENYQVIFPEDVEYGASHGKTQFVSWPVGAENYDEPGDRKVDISWWKNHRNSFSTFAWQSESDFFGGYDHGRQAGLVHIADHELVPGKKFWEWGAGPAGRIWDQILSDTDGPYIELMGGGYTDNQPDYSWIQPHEVKVFRQYWYPVRQLGGFRKANLDAALNLETDAAGVIHFALNTTAEVRGATARIQAGDRTLFEEVADIGPAKPFERQLPLPAGVRREDLRASLNAGGRELIFYQPSQPKASPPPEPVQPPPPPADIRSGDELFLAGQRLDEFYSPVHEPDEYYEELLRRDPGDSRANTALASLYCRRGLFSQAEQRARVAIARLTNNYTQPKDREAYFYLGLALKMQGRLDEAYSSFQKAAYSNAWFVAANFASAEIRAAQGDAPRALELADLAISRNTLDTKAFSLKAAMLRRMGRLAEARSAAEAALAVDPLDFWAANELALSAAGSPEGARLVEELRLRMRDDPQSYLELAIDYGCADALRGPFSRRTGASDGALLPRLLLCRQGGSRPQPRALPARRADARGLLLPLPAGVDRGSGECDESQPGRRAGAVLSGQSAVRHPARESRQPVGSRRRARPRIQHRPPQPRRRLRAPHDRERYRPRDIGAGKGRLTRSQIRPAFQRARRALRAGRHAHREALSALRAQPRYCRPARRFAEPLHRSQHCDGPVRRCDPHAVRA
jgi:tetratricopeptide (TPR) repeat protein